MLSTSMISNRSATTLAWGQLDVVTCILSEVQSNDTLANLAQVSQTISALALSKLWQMVDNIALLVRYCMPQEYWEELRYDRYSREYTERYRYVLVMSDHTREGDWVGERFRTYASRIKSLGTGDNDDDHNKSSRKPWESEERRDPEKKRKTYGRHTADRVEDIHTNREKATLSCVHTDVLGALHAYNREHVPLFPNLRELRWAASGARDLKRIRLFLIPSLTTLRFSASPTYKLAQGLYFSRDYGPTLVAIIAKAFKRCSSLHSVDLGPILAAPSPDILIGSPLHNLRLLHCNCLMSHDLLRAVATAPHLQSLEVITRPGFLLDDLNPIFPVLRDVKISLAFVDDLEYFVWVVQSTSIHTMELDFSVDATLDRVTRLLQIISQSPSADSLERLVVTCSSERMKPFLADEIWEDTENEWIGERIRLANVEPLFELWYLRYLKLRPLPFDWTAPIIPDMLQAWQGIEVIDLPGHERISLREFVEVVQFHGSYLRQLPVLVICPRNDPGPVSHVIKFRQLAELKFTMDHGTEPISDREALAYHIATTFPNLLKCGRFTMSFPKTDVDTAAFIALALKLQQQYGSAMSVDHLKTPAAIKEVEENLEQLRADWV